MRGHYQGSKIMVYLSPDEAEQWDLIKGFFKGYGRSLFWGLGLFIIIVTAFFYWQQWQAQRQAEASDYYQQWYSALEKEKNDEAKSLALLLSERYHSTAYGIFAQFFLLKEKASQAEWAQAISGFEKLRNQVSHAVLRELAVYRLARVMVADQQFAGALLLLDTVKPKGFLLNFLELRGDIYYVQKEYDKARHWYQKASLQREEDQVHRPLLVLKSQALGTE
jgi:predicted negative regulator of RcsB-dependent stress response